MRLFMHKTLLFGLIILFLVTGFLSSGSGQMMSSIVGVSSGDFFQYKYTCYFNSDDPHAASPASFSLINQTDYFMINVTDVSGSTVHFDTSLRGLNGSSTLGVCSMNVGTGMSSISGYGGPPSASSFYFMARNVGMMGRMFPSSLASPTINGSVMMPYAGEPRLTNHFVTTSTSNGVSTTQDFYYDQATGMMVQWRQETIQVSGTLQTNATQMMNVASSNVWVIAEFPTNSILLVLMVAGSTIAIVSRMAKFKKMKPTVLSS
jgi:hypothetical protein